MVELGSRVVFACANWALAKTPVSGIDPARYGKVVMHCKGNLKRQVSSGTLKFHRDLMEKRVATATLMLFVGRSR